MKKRFISTLLLSAMLTSLAACSGESTSDNGGSTSVENSGSGVPGDVDYGGETVKILNLQYYDRMYYLLNSTEITGDSINDSVYERNLGVMDDLGVKLEIQNMNQNEYATIRSSIMAGDDTWDIIMGVQYRLSELTPEGLFTDLVNAEYIDLAKPWWMGDYTDDLNIGNKHIYMLAGDFSIGHLNQYGAVYYNKAVYEDYYGDPDGLYKTVLDGKWTLDKLYELSSGISKDINGDTKIDTKDLVGLAMTKYGTEAYHLAYGAGADITVEENGIPKLDGLTEKNISILDKVSRLYYENPGFAELVYENGLDHSQTTVPAMLSEDRLLFSIDLLSGADLLRDMKSDYGIIPRPMFEEGGEYRTLVHDQAATMVVPVTCKEFERACAVMEEMTYLGYRDMIPEYYSVVLKQKYMRDDQDDAMKIVDMIHDSGSTDLAYMYNGNLSLIFTRFLKDTIRDQKPYASVYDANIEAASTALEALVEFYNK